MAAATINPSPEGKNRQAAAVVALCPVHPAESAQVPVQRNTLQNLLAFLALQEQVRRRNLLETPWTGGEGSAPEAEFEEGEHFTLNEVLQLVAERAIAITGADGLAIALAEGNEIILRVAAGTIRPDSGSRIDHDSAFSGACFRTAQILKCDDSETDVRVNLQACRRLGARSMVAVPLSGREHGIGVLQAFSEQPFGFDDRDVRTLSLLAELVIGALTREDESRLAESAQVAAENLEDASRTAEAPLNTNSPARADRADSIEAALVIARRLLEEATQADQTTLERTGSMLAEPALERGEMSSEYKLAVVAEPSSKPGEPCIVASEPAPATKLNAVPIAVAGTSAEATHRPGMMVLLLCSVIVSTLAGGVWWSLRTSRLAKVVQTKEIPTKPMGTVTKDAASSPTAGPVVNPANINRAAAPAGSRATNSSTKPRESSNFPMVTGIQHWSARDSSTVEVNLEDQVQYEAHRLANPDRIYFDLHDTLLASNISWKPIEVGDALLERIRVAQTVAGTTRIVLETRARTDFSVSLESNPYRLVVEVHKADASRKGVVNRFPNTTEAAKSKLPVLLSPPTQEDLQLQQRVPKMRVVVDAGHGGRDRGTVGTNGLLEKDLVLEIAQRLGKLLEGRLGMDVIYTRQDDSYIPLDERASIANQAQADLFISVHANYSDLPSARGVETYYTHFFIVPASKDVDVRTEGAAAREATASLSPADLEERAEQSRRLAESVQRSLYGTLSAKNLGLRDRGIKEANFVVLTESAMPGILAEVSFVSSPADEQKLRSDSYREEVAEALYKGIARYAAGSDGIKVASERR